MAQKHNPESTNAPMTRMGSMELSAQQRIIRGSAFTAASFSSDNPILQLGELGYETDTHLLKVGDGVTKWNDLAYAGDGALPPMADNSGKFLTNNGTVASWATLPTEVPSQAGNSGKFLTTDGTDASWASLPTEIPAQAENSGKFLTTDGTAVSWAKIPFKAVAVELAVADWDSDAQTVTVSGVKADNIIFTAPAPASEADAITAGISCSAQALDSLTFTCSTTPTEAITVNVLICD